jgi:hypothetical protein
MAQAHRGPLPFKCDTDTAYSVKRRQKIQIQVSSKDLMRNENKNSQHSCHKSYPSI